MYWKNKSTLIIILIIFVSSQIFIDLTKGEITSEPSFKSYSFRGINFKFKSQEIIIDCGSQFYQEIILENKRPFKRFFSVVVFMKIEDNNGNYVVYRIGNEPFVQLKPKETKTIRIQCLTYNNFIENLKLIESRYKNELKFKNGFIGIQITKSPIWIFDAITWNRFINNNIIFNLPANKILNIFTVNPFFNAINTIFRKIFWSEPIKFVDPFVCTKDIYLEDVNITTNNPKNQVIKNETIYVSFTIYNNLEYDINLSTHVDLSSKKFINAFVPLLPDELYNLGFNKTTVDGYSSKKIYMICNFPNESFERANYSIQIECGPYIDMNESNLFGIYGYNYRYQTYIIPKYHANESVKKSARDFWYNLPIFDASDDDTLFLTAEGYVNYIDNTPIDDAVDNVLTKLWSYKIEIIVIILIIMIPYAFFVGLLNWFIRKKT